MSKDARSPQRSPQVDDFAWRILKQNKVAFAFRSVDIDTEGFEPHSKLLRIVERTGLLLC
ncbi:MAG: hypothetical protein VR78_17775 [Hoeflea sp. BRH_c9]|nr:MAG: hypothetical protein VR78_17775 [Hoeflea sp. BRH_c9]